ncbi:MAG: hypothetical protein IKA36_02690, partial [Clostridia bacterium]|nr:hypothetical protein [Clostridia bacterium]
MSELKFDETKIPENFSKTLVAKNFTFAAAHVNKIGRVILDAVSRCLGSIKDIDKKQAVVFKGLDNTFLAAAVVKYHKNEDDPDNLASGN